MRKKIQALFSCIRVGPCLTLACLALWHAPMAQAQLLVYEGFDYSANAPFPNPTNGTLNGGFGWDDGWTTQQFVDGDPNAPGNSSQSIVPDGLTYTDSQGNQLQTTGGTFNITGPYWNTQIAATQRDIDLSPTGPAGAAGLLNSVGSLGKYGTTIWMSVLLEGRDQELFLGRGSAGGIGSRDLNISGRNRGLGLGRPTALKLDGTTGHPSDPAFTEEPNETYGFARSDDNVVRSAGFGEASIFVASGVPAGITNIEDIPNSEVGQTAVKVFMVLKLDFFDGFDEFAKIDFNVPDLCGPDGAPCGTNISAWINPDLDADLVNDPLGPKAGTNFANEFNMWEISLTQISLFGNANLMLDEFRIGATYADVAPIDASPGQDGDFDGDLDVDGADFLRWQRDMGDATNLALWETNYGTTAGAAVTSVVPEPSALVLVGMALAGFARLRCKEWSKHSNACHSGCRHSVRFFAAA